MVHFLFFFFYTFLLKLYFIIDYVLPFQGTCEKDSDILEFTSRLKTFWMSKQQVLW